MDWDLSFGCIKVDLLATERIEKNIRSFWLESCGIDTHRRGSGFAQLDTPWNAFDREDVLVCTLWSDQIVRIFDPVEERDRRFVRIGGRKKAWRGPAIKHGQEADENLKIATDKKLRVIGFEAEPNATALLKNERRVSHFYLDRAHELRRVFDFSSQEMLERLKVDLAFEQQVNHKRSDETSASYLFELVGINLPIEAERENGGESETSLHIPEDASATERNALKAVRILIGHVLAQKDDILQPLTYLELAGRLGRRNRHGSYWARGLGHVLGRVTTMLESVQAQIPETIPYLTTIVVLSTGTEIGLPDAGIRHRWPDYDQYTRLEKEAKVTAEYVRILEFGRHWNDVLMHLGLPQIELPSTKEAPFGTKNGGWAGGESAEHKALKLFVKANPALVGADYTFRATDEYALRSGDEIDVFFKSEDHWIGVEVKSSVSDGLERDYERGLYQVVKYRAVLEAQAMVDHPAQTPTVTVFLVLENQLPKKYRPAAKRLGICIKENIKPTTSATQGISVRK
ncbi:hypothetical protein ACEN8I_23615 [Polaromonas sp. CT11-55]|uniref:hypothetical protein n=1 Tax=Polaromonas sp. CT11-55 TaxID=3243045 RepID=UPI0039A4C255